MYNNVKIYKSTSLILVIVFFISCVNTNSIEKKIREKIEKDCQNEDCYIPITELTFFTWNKMFVFNYPSSPDDIDQALGMHYPHYVEFTRSIIFLNNNQIVHYENNDTKVEAPTEGEVIFDYPDSLNYQVYIPGQKIFKVKRKKSKNISYYLLSVK